MTPVASRTDPRSVITPDAFHVSPELLGLRLASGRRRLAAILAGLLIVGGTSENPLGLRLMGVVAGLSILAGYLVFRGYRLPDTVTAETVSLDGTRRTAPAITAGPS